MPYNVECGLPELAQRIIRSARMEPCKGDYTVYERYRRQLSGIDLTPEEYQTAVRYIAEGLRV